MAKSLGAIVGALIGGALSFLAAKKYEIPAMVYLGPAYYPLALAAGTISGALAGKWIYNSK